MGFSIDPCHVEGNLFNENGKWKYTVLLDYNGGDWDTWDLWTEARNALRRATEAGVSGVVSGEVHPGWTLVVFEPYGRTAHPIMVRGERPRPVADWTRAEFFGIAGEHGPEPVSLREPTRNDAIKVAQAFHEAYERLAPLTGYKTRPESAVPWEDVPIVNRTLMANVVQELLRREVIRLGGEEHG